MWPLTKVRGCYERPRYSISLKAVLHSSLTHSQISCPLDTVCSQTPSHHGLGIHYSSMGEESSNTGQKLERVKRSGHRSSLQRFFRKLIATVPGAGRSVIMFSQIYPMPIFTAKILINLKETLHCKVGTPAPQCATLHCGL